MQYSEQLQQTQEQHFIKGVFTSVVFSPFKLVFHFPSYSGLFGRCEHDNCTKTQTARHFGGGGLDPVPNEFQSRSFMV